MKLKVDVKQEHIDSGVPRSSYYCPIAKALKDCGCTSVTVGVSTATVIYGDKEYKGVLPSNAYSFRFYFDLGSGERNPISFELELEPV